MGFFSNGIEGLDYEERYCRRCVNYRVREAFTGQPSCPVMDLHLEHNSEGANNPDSFLHVLIPMNGTWNAECSMFLSIGDRLAVEGGT